MCLGWQGKILTKVRKKLFLYCNHNIIISLSILHHLMAGILVCTVSQVCVYVHKYLWSHELKINGISGINTLPSEHSLKHVTTTFKPLETSSKVSSVFLPSHFPSPSSAHFLPILKWVLFSLTYGGTNTIYFLPAPVQIASQWSKGFFFSSCVLLLTTEMHEDGKRKPNQTTRKTTSVLKWQSNICFLEGLWK